ncbi:MAG: sigma 54-interacting transcriptional regulator [Candidatus Eisenbacteria bacterium]
MGGRSDPVHSPAEPRRGIPHSGANDAARKPLGSPGESGDDEAWKLVELARELSSIQDETKLLSHLLAAAIEISGAERGMVLTYTEADGFDLVAARDLTGDLGQEEAANSRSLCLRAIREDHPARLDGANFEPITKSVGDLKIAQAFAVPIRRRGVPSGVLYVDSRTRRMAMGSDKLTRVLQALAHQVSSSLKTTELIRELEEQRASLEERNQALTAEVTGGTGIDDFVGESLELRAIASKARQYADLRIPVLVRGEPGVGKDVVCRALHAMSRRRNKPLILVNCPGLTKELGASELFGHVKGAFTGAVRDHRGKVEEADGSTLFFDEVGDLPIELQPMLLVFLQRGSYQRVGENTERESDARVVAATNRDLEAMIRAGTFRQDLLDRLDGVTLRIPPIRDRRADIRQTAEHFLAEFEKKDPRGIQGFTKRATNALENYDWPDNVRGIFKCVQLAQSSAPEGGLIDLDHLRERLPSLGEAPSAAPASRGKVALADAVAWAERQAIVDALERNRWNIARTAIELGISRQHLHNRIRHYELQRPGGRRGSQATDGLSV